MDRPQTPLGSWQACLSAAGRPVVASLWPVRSLPPLFLWASEGDVRHFGPRPQTFLQAAAWPRKLFLWASEGDVRNPRAPPPNPSRQLAGLPLSSYGLPRATLGIVDRSQTPLGSWQACLSAAGRPVVASLWPVRSLPPLFLWASEGDVRHFGPRPQTPLASFLQAAAWPRKLFLWASEGDVRDPRAPPSNPPRQPAGLPRPLCGLSEACPFSSPTGPARKRSCRPQLGPESFFYGLPKATLETHGPRPQTPLGSWQACLSLLMGFREQR